MNIYYAPREQIHSGLVELTGQEARHASKVMRAREGDRLVIVDGRGGRYEGPIRRITKQSVQVEIEDRQHFPEPQPQLILGMGILKKRDRMEFAVEKAVELGAQHIILFRSEHTVKQNVRMDRLESIVLSAMKQSLHTRLPSVTMVHSVEEAMDRFPDAQYLMAHEKVDDSSVTGPDRGADQLLLLIGPEGGFSEEEVSHAADNGAQLISLGNYRLRAETAAVAFMSQFISAK